MIPFNLTALTRGTPLIQRKAKNPRNLPYENPAKFHPIFIHNFNFQPNQLLHFKSVFFSTTALRYLKNKAVADMTPTFFIKEDEEPMATEPIYLSSDESEYSTPNTTADHHDEGLYINSNNQLIASQLEQRSNMDIEAVFCPPTPNTFMISDTEEQSNLTPIFGDPEHSTSPISQ